MTRRATLLTAVVMLGAGLSILVASEVTPQPTEYLIRVTSATPGTEVKFDAAILFRPANEPLQTFSRKTPYELRSTALATSAMFTAHGPVGIQVELVGMQGGKQRTRSTATGHAVVVGDNVLGKAAGYITTF